MPSLAHFYRRALLVLAMVPCCAGWALAQQPPAVEPQRSTQKTERIQIEDAGSRIDELRVGGQTKSITVQPKVGDVPAYEVQPSDGVRNLPGSRNGSESSTGPRVWNVMKF